MQALDKIIPDPQAAADAKLKAMEMAQRGDLAVLDADLKIALGQIAVNQEEAKTDLFRGGWRPGAGWVCVFGLAYQALIRPMGPWAFRVLGLDVPDLPEIDTETLTALLFGMLGLGGFRTFERVRGKA
ncbi:MAG: holin family protein [Aquabacterium sp.]|nr:holin family protein [Aquabacterium sp.]